MAESRSRAVWLIVVLVVAGTITSIGERRAEADVTAVTGSACNYYTDVGLFGGPRMRRGCGQPGDAPATAASPSVTLPATGSATPVTANDPDGARAQYGPAVIFGGRWPEEAPAAPPSGPLTASCQGTTGAGGSVTCDTAVTLYNPPPSAAPGGAGPGPFVADEVRSTCTARETDAGTGAKSLTGSATIRNGVLELRYDPNTQLPVVTEPIPENVPVNHTREGTIDHVGDRFRIVLNEHVTNPDGSLTVNAAHMFLLGPTAVGELVVGSVTCGVTTTAGGGTTTTQAGGTTTTQAGGTTTTQAGGTTTTQAQGTTTTQAGGATTTQAQGTTTTQAPATTTTAASGTTTTTAAGGGGSVSGSACGYFTNVGLFGGPPNRRGCGQPANAPATNASPSVTLPAAGSATPITATDEDGATAEYGPAKIFAGQYPDDPNAAAPPSGPITVSTQGTPGGEVTSSAQITLPRGVGPGPVIADGVRSTCTASASGTSGSTTITNGKLETRYDASSQLPTATEDVPANPPVGYTREGTIDHVGDRYRVVYNEQIVGSDGSITVNAVRMELLGPTAVGEMVIAQSVCGRSAGGGSGGGGSGGGGSGGGGSGGGSGGVASTGANVLRTVAVALLFVAAGAHVRFWAPQLQWAEAGGDGGRRRRAFPRRAGRPRARLRKRPWD
ncbi:MAG TPA: hypothetical protein VHF27_12690 [Acidimicrobiales bacterium]|nr:hypothetical protein [Acidimicrobiales bacterium]